MKCRHCQTLLTELWLTDITNMRVNPMMLFCNNANCPLFGLLTVVGVPEPKDKILINHKRND